MVIREVVWQPPPINWIKINTDGAARGSPGDASCGGVFRNFTGGIIGSFSSFLGTKTPLEAEIHGVILAVQIAWNQGWHNIWLECDSTLTVSMIKNGKSEVPISIKEKWHNTLEKISKMEVIVSHIYREGNEVADKLADHGMRLRDGFTWFNSPPNFIIEDALLDASGYIRHRVRNSSF